MARKSKESGKAGAGPEIWGLLGGMGPWAQAMSHAKLLRLAAWRGAKEDWEYPEVVSVGKALAGYGADGVPQDKMQARRLLREGEKKLHALGAEKILFACVSLFDLAPSPKERLLPWLDVAGSWAQSAKKKGWVEIGGLASRETRDGLKLKKGAGQKIVWANEMEQLELDRAIEALLDQKQSGKKEARRALFRVKESMKKRGAKGFVLGCTEFSALREEEALNGKQRPEDEVCVLESAIEEGLGGASGKMGKTGKDQKAKEKK